MAQTLTSTFHFTGSGFIGTPATASTPFQGQTFSSAAITIVAVANTANRQTNGCDYIPNDSASVTISGIGTYQLSTVIVNCVITDPVKGVTGNIIYFKVSSVPTAKADFSSSSPVATAISNPTAWNMFSSFGPFQSQIDLSPFPMATSGGTLQFTSQGSSGTFQATFSGTPPAPTLTRSGVLSHIAAGGGWTTVITLVNTSSAALAVSVVLHNDDGSALTLPVTITQQGASQPTTTASVSATINPNATLLISTGQLASTVVGWADVLSSGSLGGDAIFRSTPQTGSPSEGTVPLQSQYPSMVMLPYDNTSGFVMGVALANLSSSLASVTVTMWDDIGNQLGTQFISIAGNGHTAFVLPNQFPLTVGKRGIVKFQATGGIAGLGLRFSPFGTFTSVPTM